MALIYHITTGPDWEQARRDGAYRLSTRGVTLAQEGFIHASTARQVPLVANAYYRGDTGLVVLVIDTDLVEPEIRYEQPPGSDETFPHIYGPLSAAAVVRVRPLAADASGRFAFEPDGPAPGAP
ncbi:MAG TPA: DUF952 domain-containing protein [Streptosporangiaceae bacterium]|nr:DUF952 domain-containing protein [Streptosporangiaceae bacterium]